jgi:hypothetical protein
MLRSAGEAGKDKKWRVGIVPQFCATFGQYYVSRTSHNVVIAQRTPGCKQLLNVYVINLEKGRSRI